MRVLAAVVRLSAACRNQRALTAADKCLPHRADVRAGERLAILIDEHAGDHAAACHPQRQSGHLLTIGQHDRRALPVGPSRSVGGGHVSLTSRRQAVAAGWQCREGEAAGIVGNRCAVHLPIGSRDGDPHPSQRTGIRIVDDDDSRENRRAGGGGLLRVSRRRLCAGPRRSGGDRDKEAADREGHACHQRTSWIRRLCVAFSPSSIWTCAAVAASCSRKAGSCQSPAALSETAATK